MQIKIIRASGNPVDEAKRNEKEAEFKMWFDKICDKYGKYGETTIKMMDRLDAYQLRKYNDLSVDEVTMPENNKEWKELMEKYGNIMVTSAVEANEFVEAGDVIFVINDMMF